MIIFDFLFYYLTYWFDKNKGKLVWSTPIQRSAYAIGLMTGSVLYSINECFELGKDKLQYNIPVILLVVCALAIMKLYEFIYVTKNRYERIRVQIPAKFKISDDTGAIISMVVVALLILSPFVITIILVPFGGHKYYK